MDTITNLAGQTFAVGRRVRHSDGWTGTVIGVNDKGAVDLLLVQPDAGAALRGYDAERPLNAKHAALFGRSTHCRPRDQGLSMGNYTPL